MSEIISQTNNEVPEGTSSDITGQLEPIIPSLEEQRDARERAEIFISEHAESLGAIMGVTGIKIEVGSGWATVLKTGTVTVDPSFFIEQGYRPDWVNYGLMHEVSAHLVGVINDPEQTRERMDFVGSDESKHLFINILEDIAGNRRIHSLLPRQRDVAHEVYSEKLFPEEDLTEIPRHFQFLYKLIREEMIVGSQTAVLPEVDDAISSIRDINGQDVIELSTSRIIKGTNEELSRSVQFQLWMEHIYPKFEELLELDDAVEDDPLAGLIDEVILDPTHMRVNFPPFFHYRVNDNKEPFLVGKSHWRGDLETGEFSKDHGEMTRTLARMFMKLCERYATRSNWRGYTYNEEMRGQALLQLSQIGLQFDESKSQNPFAYYTAAITNSFTRILNIEKKMQNIRDDILEMNGLNPSWTRQNSGKHSMEAMSGPVVSTLDE